MINTELLNAVIRRALDLREATATAEKASRARAALPPGSSRARVTTANARWTGTVEHRDRCESLLADALFDAGFVRAGTPMIDKSPPPEELGYDPELAALGNAYIHDHTLVTSPADNELRELVGEFRNTVLTGGAIPAELVNPSGGRPGPTVTRVCNRHDDCDAADAKARASGRACADHCHDDCCDDCFGS